jgi:hypothetical protein
VAQNNFFARYVHHERTSTRAELANCQFHPLTIEISDQPPLSGPGGMLV